jgi:putative phage-type endonuclease
MIFHDVIQNSQEWEDLRRGKFTASNFKDLFMGEDTAGYQKAIYRVVYERLTGQSPDSYSNTWMARGHELEPEAREQYEFATFNKVHNGGFYEPNKDTLFHSWVGASPDGNVEDGLVEIKCPAYNTMISYLLNNDKLVKDYTWQVQGQLWIAEKKWCDLTAYHPNLPLLKIRIRRDGKAIKELSEKTVIAINKAHEALTKLKGVECQIKLT